MPLPPSHAHSSQSIHLIPIYRRIGPPRAHQVFTRPNRCLVWKTLAIIDLGSLQVLRVEVVIEVAATVDLSLKLFSGHLFQVEDYDRDWTFVYLSL